MQLDIATASPGELAKLDAMTALAERQYVQQLLSLHEFRPLLAEPARTPALRPAIASSGGSSTREWVAPLPRLVCDEDAEERPGRHAGEETCGAARVFVTAKLAYHVDRHKAAGRGDELVFRSIGPARPCADARGARLRAGHRRHSVDGRRIHQRSFQGGAPGTFADRTGSARRLRLPQ
ncbi:hypothetical protein FXW78_50545 [Rhodococcus opacus]|nr:hypothetical protein [Rhodococcus opacus]